MKAVSIIGARPQFVKEAALQKQLKLKGIEEVLIHTGQHYDSNMSDVFFDVLKMDKPKYNLGINGATHGEMTGRMMIELEKIINHENPDIVILYGDTDSTLAGAIVASKMNVEIVHIEAGLRQEPKAMPEETNRVLTDRVAKYLFCPTTRAIDNLKQENIVENVVFTGDVMYDVFCQMKNSFEYSLVEKLKLTPNEYIVMTLHRDFNVDNRDKLESILKQVEIINKQIPIVWPIHPRTKQKIQKFKLEKYIKGVRIVEPLDYLQLMGLTMKSKCVITDSGGYQKEAYFAKKQAYIIMPDTAWKELVECEWNTLVDETNLVELILKENNPKYIEGLYGEGNAVEIICDYLVEKKDGRSKNE